MLADGQLKSMIRKLETFYSRSDQATGPKTSSPNTKRPFEEISDQKKTMTFQSTLELALSRNLPVTPIPFKIVTYIEKDKKHKSDSLAIKYEQ